MPAYYSAGSPGPDSNKVDSDGNLYQCIMGQGRIVVLNAQGIPVASVIIPGRDEGKLLRTTNLAFKPGTAEGYITTSGRGGAWIYRFTGLAEGLPLFSHA
jgi:lactonase